MLHVEIDRSRWLRGGQRSLLAHPATHHRCCMGFACVAAGHAEAEIDNVRTITELAAKRPDGHVDRRLRMFEAEGTPDEHKWAHAPDPRQQGASETMYPVTRLIYTVNDDARLHDAVRERYLRHLGRQIGIEFSFSGNALPPTAGKHEIPSTEELFGDLEEGERLPPAMAAFSLLDPESRTWQAFSETTIENQRSAYDLMAKAYTLLWSYADMLQRAVRVQLTTTDDGRNLGTAYGEPSA